jgi:hypothetical protein
MPRFLPVGKRNSGATTGNPHCSIAVAAVDGVRCVAGEVPVRSRRVLGPVADVSGARPTIATVSKIKRPPTDFELLRAIYEEYRDEFAASPTPKVVVPIDIPKIAAELGVGTDSVFGRLYYHLEPMYGETDEKGRKKIFFSPLVNDDANCVNFPLLEAVLAGLWQQRRRDLWTVWIAVVSIGIAIGSLTVAIVMA